jgi:hypothetical protein
MKEPLYPSYICSERLRLKKVPLVLPTGFTAAETILVLYFYLCDSTTCDLTVAKQ